MANPPRPYVGTWHADANLVHIDRHIRDAERQLDYGFSAVDPGMWPQLDDLRAALADAHAKIRAARDFVATCRGAVALNPADGVEAGGSR